MWLYIDRLLLACSMDQSRGQPYTAACQQDQFPCAEILGLDSTPGLGYTQNVNLSLIQVWQCICVNIYLSIVQFVVKN